MIVAFPQENKQFIQTNRSDVLGNIGWTNNIDFQSRLGRIRVSPRFMKTTDSLGIANFGLPVGFRYFTGSFGGASATYLIAPAGTSLAYTSTLTSNFAVDETSVCDPLYSDIEVFGTPSYLWYTSGSTLRYRKTADATGTTVSGLTATNYPHMLAAYASRLYVTDKNIIRSLADPAGGSPASLTTSLTLTDNFLITWIRPATDRIWIGTIDVNKGRGYVFEWDGASSQATHSHRLEAQGALACVIQNDVPYVMDSDGVLLNFSGGDFREVTVNGVPMGRLPTGGRDLINGIALDNNRFIHPNGMTLHNKRVQMLINAQFADNSIGEPLPSGIWTFDPQIGLTHTASLTFNDPSNSGITDYGQRRLSKVGALTEVKQYNSVNGQVMAGADVNTDNSTTIHASFCDDFNDTQKKFGYIVTNKFEASGQSIEENYQKVFANYRRLLNSTDKITIKYRLYETDPTEISITWTSTTTFTTVDSNMANYAVGDEVEGTQGVGGNLCSHITSIVNNSGTYTVTVDETYTGVTNGKTAKVLLQKWIKLIPQVNDQTSQTKEMDINKMGQWIQFKICMLFTGKNQFEELVVVSQTYQQAI